MLFRNENQISDTLRTQNVVEETIQRNEAGTSVEQGIPSYFGVPGTHDVYCERRESGDRGLADNLSWSKA